jgi:hypothetical protein
MGRESVLFKLLQVLGQSANPPAAVFFLGKKLENGGFSEGKSLKHADFHGKNDMVLRFYPL